MHENDEDEGKYIEMAMHENGEDDGLLDDDVNDNDDRVSVYHGM